MDNILTIIQETVILGRKIQMYGSIESPLFKATDVAEWIEHSKVSMMLKSVDDNEKFKVNNVYSENRTGGNGTWFLTEDGLYEVCMQSRKPIVKQMKKEMKKYLNQYDLLVLQFLLVTNKRWYCIISLLFLKKHKVQL